MSKKVKEKLDVFLESMEKKNIKQLNEGVLETIKQKINDVIESDAFEKFMYGKTEDEVKDQLKEFDDAFLAYLANSDPKKSGGMQLKQIKLAKIELENRLKYKYKL